MFEFFCLFLPRAALEIFFIFSTRFSYFTLVNEKTIYLEAVIGETGFE
jgi:hypothetical protein